MIGFLTHSWSINFQGKLLIRDKTDYQAHVDKDETYTPSDDDQDDHPDCDNDMDMKHNGHLQIRHNDQPEDLIFPQKMDQMMIHPSESVPPVSRKTHEAFRPLIAN
jgi:hypothetical protein